MIKQFIKELLSKHGYRLHKVSCGNDPMAQILTTISLLDINTIFDVGANKGQFAKLVRQYGYKGRIISFEPLSSARQSLLLGKKDDDTWILHEHAALGDRDGEIRINVAGNSVSSSVLPMLASHHEAAPGSEYVDSEVVPIRKLDSIADRYLTADTKLFIKIDTQGYEWQVLEGASNTLERTCGLLCELSLTSLYEGQRLWKEIIDKLERDGFHLWALQNAFTNELTGQSLQVDGLFIRRSKLTP